MVPREGCRVGPAGVRGPFLDHYSATVEGQGHTVTPWLPEARLVAKGTGQTAHMWVGKTHRSLHGRGEVCCEDTGQKSCVSGEI